MISPATRAADETLLEWLRRRASGVSSTVIAKEYGVTGERVRTATSRVMQADLRESGERASRVEPHYWNPAPGGRS